MIYIKFKGIKTSVLPLLKLIYLTLAVRKGTW